MLKKMENGSVKKIIKMICNLTSLLIQMLITHICICIKLLPLYVNLETCNWKDNNSDNYCLSFTSSLENKVINILLSISMPYDSHKIIGGVILTSEPKFNLCKILCCGFLNMKLNLN